MLSKKEIYYKANYELSKLHFNFSYYGTIYLRDCVYLMHIKKRKYDINITKEIFPILCKKYNKSIDTIHSNIKKSINNMYYDCEEKIVYQYIGYEGKPSAKKLLIRILENIE